MGAGEPVAEINLSTLAVTYHALTEHISFLARLRDSLKPTAQAKGFDGPQRDALGLGGGR